MSGPNGNSIDPGPPLHMLAEAFEQAKASNQAKLADLQRQGLEMDPLSFVHARIDKLIDSIAQFAGPNGPRWSLMARLAFEQHIATELKVAEAEGRKAQLALGSQFTPAMIARLAAETGMFRRRA